MIYNIFELCKAIVVALYSIYTAHHLFQNLARLTAGFAVLVVYLAKRVNVVELVTEECVYAQSGTRRARLFGAEPGTLILIYQRKEQKL